MARVKSGKVTHARHKKVLDAAKGYYGNRSRNFRTATQAVDKANHYATRDRKNRKRNFRALWIQRINAAVRLVDAEMTYSRFINLLAKAGIEVDRSPRRREVLSQIFFQGIGFDFDIRQPFRSDQVPERDKTPAQARSHLLLIIRRTGEGIARPAGLDRPESFAQATFGLGRALLPAGDDPADKLDRGEGTDLSHLPYDRRNRPEFQAALPSLGLQFARRF